MSEMASKRPVSGHSMKMVAAGVSLAALAAGFLGDDSGQDASSAASSTSGSSADTSLATDPALPSSGRALHAAIAKGDGGMVDLLVESEPTLTQKTTSATRPSTALF